MTILTYFDDSYKFRNNATIIETNQDENGFYLLLDNTIFYPQGGGQPSDSGQIVIREIVIPISSVKNINSQIRHYTDQDYHHLLGNEGLCEINMEKRLLHAKLHTAGHLISHITENIYPNWQAVKGHHFPDKSYIEFTPRNDVINEIDLNIIFKEIVKHIDTNSLVNAEFLSKNEIKNVYPNLDLSYFEDDQPIRIIRIGDFSFFPCGGTHVKSLKELNGLRLDQYKIKKALMKIYYSFTTN